MRPVRFELTMWLEGRESVYDESKMFSMRQGNLDPLFAECFIELGEMSEISPRQSIQFRVELNLSFDPIVGERSCTCT